MLKISSLGGGSATALLPLCARPLSGSSRCYDNYYTTTHTPSIISHAGRSQSSSSSSSQGQPSSFSSRFSREHVSPPLPPSTHPHHHQQHEYHQISEKWLVPRNNKRDYPQQTQAALDARNKQKNAQAQAPPPPPSRYPDLVVSLQKLLRAIQYEANHGYPDVKGGSGEHFSQFVMRTLRDASTELGGAGEKGLAQRCAMLADRTAGPYRTSGDIIVKEMRAALLETLTSAVNSIVEQLRQPPPVSTTAPASVVAGIMPMQGQQTSLQQATAPTIVSNTTTTTPAAASAPTPAQPNIAAVAAAVEDLDDVAAEAHLEETAELPITTTTATSTNEITTSTSTSTSTLTPTEQTSTLVEDDKDDEYIVIGGRRLRRETYSYRQSFAEAALRQAHGSSTRKSNSQLADGEQRTAEWMALRERRLTASAFAKALGFFNGDRVGLWEEKVGLRAPFKGNEATQWGTRSEPVALDTYCQLTGQIVEPCMFKMKRDDPPHAWLGASPDGLLPTFAVVQQPPSSSSTRSSKYSAAPYGEVSGGLHTPLGPGILEIKCPYNKGHPEFAVPPAQAIWYYMPQLQGLMDVFDREWCHLYVWTPQHGSVAFLVARDRRYWTACFQVLADFWWCNVVPARQARDAGAQPGDRELEALRPVEWHEASEKLKAWSKRLALAAPAQRFGALPTSSVML